MSGTIDSPIILSDSPVQSPVKVLPGDQFRYATLVKSFCSYFKWSNFLLSNRLPVVIYYEMILVRELHVVQFWLRVTDTGL